MIRYAFEKDVLRRPQPSIATDERPGRTGLVIQGIVRFVERLQEGVPLSAFWRGWRLRRHVRAEGLVLVLPGGPMPLVINRGGDIEIESCSFESGVRMEIHENATLSIGKGTYINRNVQLVVGESVSIGRGVKIGWDTVIMDTDLHGHSGQPTKTRPIVIEDDVWIGCRAVILKGVTIGKGAIVAAGAIVTKDVPSNAVVASPCAEVVAVLRAPAVEPALRRSCGF